MARVDSWVQQLKKFNKKVYVGGTSQGGILTFAFAKRSSVAAMVDGIICFNSWVNLETRAPV
jgi:alpha-beta hydrolase superfamily lysophospholipase